MAPMKSRSRCVLALAALARSTAAHPCGSAAPVRGQVNGLPKSVMAVPQCAIAHDGSALASASKVFAPSAYQNECSSATPRWKRGCTSALQELAKCTVPSFSIPSPCASASLALTRNAQTTSPRIRFVFILASMGYVPAGCRTSQAPSSSESELAPGTPFWEAPRVASGFGQFCPVAVACEVFAERWTPLIIRELLAGVEKFNDIHRGIPLISRALLTRRLRELEAARVITREALPSGKGRRYCLTEAGKEFHAVIEGLGAWGQRWTVRVDPKRLDPAFLLWTLRRPVAVERLPARPVVVRFNSSGVPAHYRGRRTFWLILERPLVDLCIDDPGFEVDLYLEADLAAMAKVWLGDVPYESMLRSGGIQLLGPRPLAKAFPSWLMLSHYAEVPRPERLAAEVKRPHLGD